MQEKERYAFFDFCETLADFQTADAFVDYVREQTDNCRMRRLEKMLCVLERFKVLKLLRVLSFEKVYFRKRLKLYQLKGFFESDLVKLANSYYNGKIRPHLIKKVVEELQQKQREGYAVGLVSGGYSIYLAFFVKEFGLDFCYACNMGFNKGYCTGKMVGMECMRGNKVKILEKDLMTNKLIKRGSVAYSDSISDLPLLRWVDTGVVVSKKCHQEWVDKYNLKELIWE